jgi:hypothetical protein
MAVPLQGFGKSKEKNGGTEYNLYSDYIRDTSKTRWNRKIMICGSII